MQVLIVDDSRLTLMALKGLLSNVGYDVVTATNGQEALEILKEHSIRIVISDWEMPLMNGIEFCRAVRGEILSGYVYFLLLTSHNTIEEMVEGLQAGADDFISKPYKAEEVLARLRAGERILSMETRDVAIFALAKLAESRDSDTGAHLERTQHYCRLLAQQLTTNEKFQKQIDPEFIRLVFQTAPLHDIGKVGIPDAILLKPGRLDLKEFEVMKTHPTIAENTLNAALVKFPNATFLQIARDIAGSHHEKWDGTGYPRGLKGDSIPLCGRIMALADVYDALITKRIYKPAFEHREAKDIILAGRGSHFDPDVVDAFVAREGEFINICRRFAREQEGIAV